MQIKGKLIKAQNVFQKYKTPILYSGSSIIKALATMVVGLVIARYISPHDLGLWTTVNLALTYSVFLQSGLINGLNLELPLAYGKGEDIKAKLMAGTVQSSVVISALVVFVIGIIYFIFSPEQDHKIKFGVLAIIFVIVFSFYQNYLISTFRSKSSFFKLSLIQILHSCLNIATLLLVIFYGYYGMIVKAVIVIFIYTLFLYFFRPIKVGLIWDQSSFRTLFKVGFPIFGLVLLDSFSATADKLWLIKFSNLTQVGLYSFAFYALSTFSLFSASVASYIYPRMTYSYGQSNDKSILWKYVKKITLLLFIVQIPIAIICYYLLPVIIETYFPEYILSIFAMQVLLFAGVFKGCVVGVNALWSIKNWKYMIIYQFIYSILLISLTYVGFQFYHNITGIAYGVLMANLFNLISGIYLTYRATRI